jgi:hypothetical protein
MLAWMPQQAPVMIESHMATKPTDHPRIGGRNETSWQINYYCPKASTLSSTCFFFGLAHWFLLLKFYEGAFSRKPFFIRERGRKMESHPSVEREEKYSHGGRANQKSEPSP